MRAKLVALTGFGDTAVLMPLAAVMLLWLLVMRSPRGAVWWAITVAFCVGMTALLKVSFYGCPPTPDLHSPSGHTSLSTLVYGAMALVTANETGGLRRIMAISGGIGFILAIAASIEPRNRYQSGCRRCSLDGRQNRRARYCERPSDPAWSETLACTDAPCAGTGRSLDRP